MDGRRGEVSPYEWAAALSAPPVVSSDPKLLRGGLLRRWSATASGMRQPPLDHHYIVVHLGGPKHVRRSGEGRTREAHVVPGQISVVPAGSTYDWMTTGPIDFMHLYVHPSRFDRAINEVFDRDARSVQLQDKLGFDDALLHGLVSAMLADLTAQRLPSRLYFESLFDTAIHRVIRLATDVADVAIPGRHALTPVKLRRVQSYVEAHLNEDLDLQTLADLAGLSRFHFCRAFQRATGSPPYLFVTQARIAKAKVALVETDATIAEIAYASGYNSASQFSSTFRKVAGLSPRAWRLRL